MGDFAAFRLLIVAVRGSDKSVTRYTYPGDLEEHVSAVERVFRSLGADEVVRIEPTDAQAIRTRLKMWADDPDPRSTIVYWLGHGDVSLGRHYLVASDSEDRLDSDCAVAAYRVAELLTVDADRRADTGEPCFTVVILDCCKAGDAAEEIDGELRRALGRFPVDLAVLGATANGSTAYGRTPQALTAVVEDRFDVNTEVTVLRLLRELNDVLGSATLRADRLGASAFPLRGRAFGSVISGAQDVVPRVVELLGNLEPEVRSHFLEKAQGAELNDLAWYFVGRTNETNQLVDWLSTSHGGMFVVTGRAGAGKSAFLGRLVTLSNRLLVEALTREGWIEHSIPDDQLPPDDCFDVVIHLTGKSLADTTTRVAAALVDFDGDPSNPEDVVRALSFRDNDRPFTVLVDALDEATQPIQIASSLLRRLAASPGTRVIVGTRRSLNEDPDTPTADDQHLLDALALRPGLDREPLVLDDDPSAQHEYIVARLTRSADYSRDTAIALADLVTQRREPFLFARLAAIEIAARRLQPDADELGPDGLLDGHHRRLFAAALERFNSTDSDVVPALRALAYSFGRGFPIEGSIWMTASRALHPHLSLTDDNLTRTRQIAAPYLIVDGEHGQTTYRLAHRTYVEHFQLEPTP